MGRYKKYLTILLMFSIHMMPFNAVRASTAADGWSISKRLVQGATTFYDGAKEVVLNGKTYAAKGTAAITPTVSQVSKMIVRTGAVLAVDLAIKALIDGVEYVMDPANNRVKYNAPGEVGDWMVNGIVYPDMTLDQACSAARPSYLHHNGSTCNYGTKDPEVIQASWAYALVSSTTTEERYLPYDAVASQIIGDAAGKEDAKAYVSSVADTALDNDEQRQIVPQSEIVNQLNQSQSIPTSNTAQGQAVPQANPDDPTAPKAPPTDIALNFPVFCDWAPSVCQAANAVINFPRTFASWEKSVTDWVKEPSNSSDKLEFNEPNIPEPDTQINFATGCPEKIPLSFSWNGQTLDFSFDFTIWCQAISTFVYPIVVSLGALHALYIVSGVRQDG
ncbi:hypothetical protein MKL33_15025 [Acinetobacter sp. AOR43_HL]|uniref:virulence factor TspB C-terminal domain-related protein n=1 Tax=Acinetobacter sp. AOR43_HL TaxID=2919390 RepID=UPI0022EB3377|nr:virulence factor TspB C-terminal domain-related protein [Acinetobacter sp. AOR43_HL]MDA3451971.1 hypothetical protein [Acinetobacter sp. AOR43_HL]MDA3453140.1 hypothetical protein [Acinetobacter sp. AOR43_HL]